MSETTPETSELRDRLAEVLRKHQIIATGLGEWCCKCSPSEWRATFSRSTHFADALLPVVAQEIAAAEQRGREASLRQAADDWQWGEWSNVLLPNATKNPIANGQRVTDWLRNRAVLAEPAPEEGR